MSDLVRRIKFRVPVLCRIELFYECYRRSEISLREVNSVNCVIQAFLSALVLRNLSF
jgi:hypothetical protein